MQFERVKIESAISINFSSCSNFLEAPEEFVCIKHALGGSSR